MRFARFGVKQHWIVECKYWSRPVPKKEVLALRKIVEELGADRGILIAERGHQSGAHEAATLANITLTTLAKLREAARGELLALAFPAVKRRAVVIQHEADSLYDGVDLVKRTAKPGADSGTLATIWGNAYVVEQGARDADLGSFPITLYTSDVDENGNLLDGGRVDCNNLEEFVLSASDILDTLERALLKQKVHVAKGALT